MQNKEIVVHIDGKKHEAFYRVLDGSVTVKYSNHEKTTHIGNSPAEAIAKMMLIEIINNL